MRTAVVLLLMMLAASARADWEDGRVPEGANAFTIGRHQLRLNIVGRSAFGLSDRVELETYLPLDCALFPNLGVKTTVLDNGETALALDVAVGAGVYPLIGGAILPLPRAFVAGGGLGFVAGSVQLVGAELSFHPTHALTFTLRANAVAIEAGTFDLVAAAGPGAAAVAPISLGGATLGGSAGVEVDAVLGTHDAIVFQADAAAFQGARSGLSLFWIGWTHAWKRFHLTLGAYAIIDLPDATMLHDELPVAPFANVYWVFR